MSIEKLRQIMVRLRDPQDGCPWDKVQTFESITPYTIEEAYEVSEAVRVSDFDELKNELGDLLLQIVYLSRIAEERQLFTFDDVSAAICDKMQRRHPQIFPDQQALGAPSQGLKWEDLKARERAAGREQPDSALADVALALPALMRAQKLQKRAARVGFDWPDMAPAQAKVHEELLEVQQAVAAGEREQILEEAGDLLFAAVNVVRHAGVDAEQALRAANHKFERRFRGVEAHIQAEGKALEACDLAEMDAAWEAVKAEEKPPAS